MSVTVEVKGLKELSEALKQMPEKIRGKALGAAVKAGAMLVQRQAQANARATFKEPTGATEKSIVAYRKRGSTPDSITYEVGVTMKKKWPRFAKKGGGKRQPAYWWFFSEFGTIKQVARPWLRPAWTQTSGQSLAMIKKMLERAVEIGAAHVPKYPGT